MSSTAEIPRNRDAVRAQSYLIINSFSSRNAGDAAIVLGTAALLTATRPARVTNASRYHAEDAPFYERHNVTVVPPVIPFPPRTRGGSSPWRAAVLVLGALAAFALVLVARFHAGAARGLAHRLRLRGLLALLESDRAIVCGGGYLYSARRPLNLTLLHGCLCVRLARLAGADPLMMPQSVGPISKRLDAALIKWAYARVDPIIVRDEPDMATAIRTMGPGHTFELCPDVAFFGWDGEPAGSEGNGAVGIVAMDWTWARPVNSRDALNEYVERLAEVADRVAGAGLEVRLFGHSRMPEMEQDDFEVAEQVVAAAASPAVALAPAGATTDVTLLRDAFAELSVVIGTRLHSCIVAMSVDTPAVGLAYQPKTRGTFSLLGLDPLCFDVESFAPDLVATTAMELARNARQRALTRERAAGAKDQITACFARHLA